MDKYARNVISAVTGVFVSAMTILPASPAERTEITWEESFQLRLCTALQ